MPSCVLNYTSYAMPVYVPVPGSTRDGTTTPPQTQCTCLESHLLQTEIVRDTAILMLQDLSIDPYLLVDAMLQLISLLQVTRCEHGRWCYYEPERNNFAAATLNAVTALPADPNSGSSAESSRSQSPSHA